MHIVAEYHFSHKQFILCVSFHSVLKPRSKFLKQMFSGTKKNQKQPQQIRENINNSWTY